MEIKEVFEKIIKFFGPGPDPDPDNNEKTGNKGGNSKLKPKNFSETLADLIIENFKDNLDANTSFIAGTCDIKFPMSFEIKLCQKDYDANKYYLSSKIPQMIKGFYGIIRTKRDEAMAECGENNVSYLPFAKYWNFTFTNSGLEKKSEDMDDETFQKMKSFKDGGRPIIISTLYTCEYDGGTNDFDDGVQTETVLSGNGLKENVDYETVKKLMIDYDIKRAQQIPFQKELPETLVEITEIDAAQKQKDDVKAVIRVNSENKKYKMTTNKMIISGNADKRSLPNLIKVNSSMVVQDHVNIVYNEESNSFSIKVANAPVAIGEGLPFVNDTKPLPLTNAKIHLIDADIWIDFDASEEIVNKAQNK